MNHVGAEQESVVRLTVRGAFDLDQSIGFGFGQRDPGKDVMRLAFCLDGYDRQVGVVVRQQAPDVLDLQVHADAGTDTDAVAGQVSRMLSVDVDGTGYDELGAHDDVAATVQRARPGLRPPLFHSAYEAALWAVLSARQGHTQMSRVRERLAHDHGRVFELAGEPVAAAPLPHQLLAVDEIPGLFAAKVPRLHAIAQAALDGRLDTATLRSLDPGDASRELQRLPGLGPFYSELIVVRALGHTDEIPTREPRCRKVAAALVGAPEELSQEAFEELAQAWRPWRNWVVVAMRAGADAIGSASREPLAD
jgi:DNA-3-methyladenine glycosylase II